jgi:hypothetical protein
MGSATTCAPAQDRTTTKSALLRPFLRQTVVPDETHGRTIFEDLGADTDAGGLRRAITGTASRQDQPGRAR